MTKWTAERATSFMTRDEWIHWAVFFVTVPSLVVGAGLRAATRPWPHPIHPRLAVMSPPVRAKLLLVVDSVPLVMAGVIALWFTAFHFIIVRANETSPPSRETWPVLW